MSSLNIVLVLSDHRPVVELKPCPFATCGKACSKHAIAIRLEAIASRLEAIAIRLEAIAIRLEAIATEGCSQASRDVWHGMSQTASERGGSTPEKLTEVVEIWVRR